MTATLFVTLVLLPNAPLPRTILAPCGYRSSRLHRLHEEGRRTEISVRTLVGLRDELHRRHAADNPKEGP